MIFSRTKQMVIWKLTKRFRQNNYVLQIGEMSSWDVRHIPSDKYPRLKRAAASNLKFPSQKDIFSPPPPSPCRPNKSLAYRVERRCLFRRKIWRVVWSSTPGDLIGLTYCDFLDTRLHTHNRAYTYIKCKCDGWQPPKACHNGCFNPVDNTFYTAWVWAL